VVFGFGAGINDAPDTDGHDLAFDEFRLLIPQLKFTCITIITPINYA
jgi:hypothetical protein